MPMPPVKLKQQTRSASQSAASLQEAVTSSTTHVPDGLQVCVPVSREMQQTVLSRQISLPQVIAAFVLPDVPSSPVPNALHAYVMRERASKAPEPRVKVPPSSCRE